MYEYAKCTSSFQLFNFHFKQLVLRKFCHSNAFRHKVRYGLVSVHSFYNAFMSTLKEEIVVLMFFDALILKFNGLNKSYHRIKGYYICNQYLGLNRVKGIGYKLHFNFNNFFCIISVVCHRSIILQRNKNVLFCCIIVF